MAERGVGVGGRAMVEIGWSCDGRVFDVDEVKNQDHKAQGNWFLELLTMGTTSVFAMLYMTFCFSTHTYK
jgi:hypothetical protein